MNLNPHQAICSTWLPAEGVQKSSKKKSKDIMSLKCTFGNRKFQIDLVNDRTFLATMTHLSEAVTKETGIPGEKQRLLFKGKGIYMDPPDQTGFITLENLNFKSGDQVLIANSRRIATDDEDRQKFEVILSSVKDTDKELATLFYNVDKAERGMTSSGNQHSALTERTLRARAIELEKKYMNIIQAANDLQFHYRNAPDQARRRQVIDNCQRQMDKVGELASAIFDRLALSSASWGAPSIYSVAQKDGPCPRTDKIYS